MRQLRTPGSPSLGIPCAFLARTFGVYHNTLLDWEQKYRDEIDNVRAVELEAIQERILPKYEQQLTELAEEQP